MTPSCIPASEEEEDGADDGDDDMSWLDGVALEAKGSLAEAPVQDVAGTRYSCEYWNELMLQ